MAEGLRSNHKFLDIACGSLRFGQYLIPFLDERHYFGLDAEPSLVRSGLAQELLFDIAKLKRPTFSHGYDFDFPFVKHFDFAIAQSLFSHLTPADILLCLERLQTVASAKSVLFFTFFEGKNPHPDDPSHVNKGWQYTRLNIQNIARSAG